MKICALENTANLRMG